MNYKNLLTKISNAAIQTTTTVDLPSNKLFYEVDLNTRTIKGPETISVRGEHYADTVYFLVDRFYDNMDLAQTNCVIHYVINGHSYIYAVPFCDVRSIDGKIIIPWAISMSATQESGKVEYFIRFYLIDTPDEVNADPVFIYNLNTKPTSSSVLNTLPTEDFDEENDALNLPSYYDELISHFNEMAQTAAVFWNDV